MDLTNVLDRAKKKTGSDNATAKALGVHRQMVSAWRSGINRPDFANGVLLCNIAGVDPSKLADALRRQPTPAQQQQGKAGLKVCILC